MTKNNSKSTMMFLIYMIIFIVLVLAFVLLFVVPSIKEYKSAKSESLYLIKEGEQLLIQEKELQQQLVLSKKESKNVILLFSQKFDESKFIIYSKNYFNGIKLTKIQNESNSSALEIYQFNASVKAKNPRMLYDFIKNLKTYESIVKINFPISISTHDANLNIDFHLSIYSMQQK